MHRKIDATQQIVDILLLSQFALIFDRSIFCKIGYEKKARPIKANFLK
jgi:hypothetical protein